MTKRAFIKNTLVNNDISPDTYIGIDTTYNELLYEEDLVYAKANVSSGFPYPIVVNWDSNGILETMTQILKFVDIDSTFNISNIYNTSSFYTDIIDQNLYYSLNDVLYVYYVETNTIKKIFTIIPDEMPFGNTPFVFLKDYLCQITVDSILNFYDYDENFISEIPQSDVYHMSFYNYNDNIYTISYDSITENSGLYIADITGNSFNLLSNIDISIYIINQIHWTKLIGDKIYFISTESDYKLYEVTLDGSITLLLDFKADNLITTMLYNNFLYIITYTLGKDAYYSEIYKYDLESNITTKTIEFDSDISIYGAYGFKNGVYLHYIQYYPTNKDILLDINTLKTIETTPETTFTSINNNYMLYSDYTSTDFIYYVYKYQ